MTDIIIRKADPEDYSRIKKLFLRVYESTFHTEAPGFTAATEGEAVYLALSGTDVVGMMTVWEPTGFIHFLFVDEDHHGLGIGSALLHKARSIYGDGLSLKCLKKNQAALSFYLHKGWIIKEDGRSEDGDFFLLMLNAHGDNRLA